MKRGVLISTLLTLTLSGAAQATDSDSVTAGQRLFYDTDCVGCHDATKDQSHIGMGPSQATIAKIYQGRKEDLIEFMRHKKGPEIDPDNYMIMELQIFTLLFGRSDSAFDALASYLLAQPQQEEP